MFPQAVAEKTADNIKERQAQAKEVAGELINKTLADPELPKKVGGFLTGILAGKRRAGKLTCRVAILTLSTPILSQPHKFLRLCQA